MRKRLIAYFILITIVSVASVVFFARQGAAAEVRTFMFHGVAFVVDTQQSGPRGRDKLYSPNWMMPMLTRQFGRHSITFRTMLSLDPSTVSKRRYPELFQSGETAYGLPIVDGQHPHDFVMELAGRYDFKISEKAGVYVYGGPVGEPALGPTPFPHRASVTAGAPSLRPSSQRG